MMTGDPDFLLEHGNHLRETLIMLEGDDGAFRLIGHDLVAADQEAAETLVALVQSTNSDRHYLLVHDAAPGVGHQFSWHPASRGELDSLSDRLGGLREHGEALAAALVQHV
jgi:hypothetical protein